MILSPKDPKVRKTNAPGILWIHGGGYFVGMKMVHMSRAVDLVKKYGAVVISPGYRLSLQSPYPAAIKDCYQALLYLKKNAAQLHMLDNLDTDTSADNHGRIWNTRKNHFGWRTYLRKNAKKIVSPYAAAARQTDYSNFPPAYTFVGDGEPFYRETLTYIENLKKAGIPAEIDIYHCGMHAFDMLKPQSKLAKKAAKVFNQYFQYAMDHYFSEQDDI